MKAQTSRVSAAAPIGHNIGAAGIRLEIRAFNSMTRFCDRETIAEPRCYPAGTTIAEVAADLGIPPAEIYLVLVNGRDVSPGLVGQVRFAHELEDGDVVAFSGPVPYSYGYGSPVV